MSFLRPSALYQLVITYSSLRWMPCQSWAFLRWPGLVGLLRLLIRLLIVLFFWSMFAQIHFISSSSMYPTLRARDRIITEWASYFIRSPAVQDIVIFQAPKKIGFREDEILIKRIVAKAGDSVEVHGGWLYINGIPQKEEYIAERPKYITNLTYVPRDHVYVLGDNRNNSCDSHVWGPLPVKNIVGRYAMSCFRPPAR